MNMEKEKIIVGLQELRKILVALSAEEVDDPEDYLMALANRADLIEVLDETIKKVEHPPIVRG